MGKNQPRWGYMRLIHKTRKQHRCEITRQIIPKYSRAWYYAGKHEGEFQYWYCTDEAKRFAELHFPNGGDCTDIGEKMLEMLEMLEMQAEQQRRDAVLTEIRRGEVDPE